MLDGSHSHHPAAPSTQTAAAAAATPIRIRRLLTMLHQHRPVAAAELIYDNPAPDF